MERSELIYHRLEGPQPGAQKIEIWRDEKGEWVAKTDIPHPPAEVKAAIIALQTALAKITA